MRTGDDIWTSPEFGAVTPCVAFSPDDSRIACGDTSGEIWVWDLRAKESWRQPGVNGSTAGKMWFSPDGSRVVTASEDGMAKVQEGRTTFDEVVRATFGSAVV